MILNRSAAAFALTLVAASPALAGNCGNTAAGFDEWLASFKKQQ